MDTLVAWPLISQRSVADCPRWMVLGSAVNCATTGAPGADGAGAGAGAGGGGGGAAGTFFLQPSANSANETARQMTVIFRLLNMNIASSKILKLLTPHWV
jgi:hypothetical protein